MSEIDRIVKEATEWVFGEGFNPELTPEQLVASAVKRALSEPVAKPVAWLAEEQGFLPGDGDRELWWQQNPHAVNWKQTPLVKAAEPVAQPVSDGYRTCEFCGCHTNAALRRCCEKGMAADKKKPSEIDRIARELCRRLFITHTDKQVEQARAALIEYGAIVREECAKECKKRWRC